MPLHALTRPGLVVTLLVAVLGLSGCFGGSGGSSSDDARAAANIKRSILKESVAGASLSTEQADCLSKKIVDKIGVDRLKKYRILGKDLQVNGKLTNVKLSTGDADAMATAFSGCVDAKGLIEKQFSRAATSMSAAQQKCVMKILTEERVQHMLSLTFQGKSDQIQPYLRPSLVTCIKPSS